MTLIIMTFIERRGNHPRWGCVASEPPPPPSEKDSILIIVSPGDSDTAYGREGAEQAGEGGVSEEAQEFLYLHTTYGDRGRRLDDDLPREHPEAAEAAQDEGVHEPADDPGRHHE